MSEPVRVTDIRSENGDEVLIEFSNGKIVVLSVMEILRAVASVGVQQPMELVN
jgi:hypothetical protein